jgi:hypothetical protein
MKKPVFLTITAAVIMMMSSLAMAQAGNTASGTLTVTATVNSSITLVFQKNAAGFAIGNPNTNTATIAFGPVQAFGGAAIGGVTQTPGANSFALSTPVDVVVNKANSASANYLLTAKLNAAPSDGQTFTVNALPVTNTSAQPINATAAYGTTTVTVVETIPFTVPNGTLLTDVISFTATSN